MKKARILALIMALVMLATVFTACGKTGGSSAEKSQGQTSAPVSSQEGQTGPVQQDDGNYTYNTAIAVFPTSWNPHTYQTVSDGDAFDYISTPLYGFDYKADYSGYEIVPQAAAADPVDVTGEYAGEQWGIAAGETGRAFRIALNPDLCWDDGTPINADTYIYSLEQVLDPKMNNYRASDFYQSSLVIHNARGYVYSGTSAILDILDADFTTYLDVNDEELLAAEGQLSDPDGNLLYASFDNPCMWFGDAVAAYDGTPYTTLEDGSSIVTKYADRAGEDGFIPLTADILADLIYLCQTNGGGYDGEWQEWCFMETTFPEVSFDEVGIKKIDDYTFDLILDKELIGFYIKYNLNTTWIVKEDLYEACKKQDATTGAWSSTYGTSVETSVSYGPYKLTELYIDQSMVWERNESWFGYSEAYADEYGTFERGVDGSTCKQYQTTKIVLTLAGDISTREEMFLKGQIDQLGLNADLLANYSSSDALYFTEGESTFYGILNSDYEMLLASENVINGGDAEGAPEDCATPYKYNKTILAIKEFRQALCYSLDRTALCAALYPAGTAAFSLFSNAVMADPENSVPVNSLESVKAAVCEFWGVTYGAGGEFATMDEAYDAITGYDIEAARQLIDEAVDTAIAEGYMTEDSIVKLTYCAATASDTETKWYNFFKDMFTQLMVGTKLEGKFEYDSDFTLGNEFGSKIQDGQCDTAWGFGWSGGTLDPYDLFQVYVDGTFSDSPYQYDMWVDWSAVDLTLNLDAGEGKRDYTYSVADWWQIINGGDHYEVGLPNWAFGKMEDSVRGEVLAQLEKAILLNYTSIPMMNEGAVQLKSYKVNFGREEYIYAVGRGGIRHITYNYTDEEWADYCASQPNGILTY